MDEVLVEADDGAREKGGAERPEGGVEEDEEGGE